MTEPIQENLGSEPAPHDHFWFQYIEQQGKVLNRWLAATAIFLSFLSFVVILAGVFGFVTLTGMEDQAERILVNVQQIQSKIQNLAEQAERDFDDARAEMQELYQQAEAIIVVAEESRRVTESAKKSVETLMSDLQDQFARGEPVESWTPSFGNDDYSALEGFLPYRDPIAGNLPDNGTDVVELELDGDYEYLIAGACHPSCTDLDLELYTSNDNELLDADYELDASPILYYNVDDTGDFHIVVDMIACALDSCDWTIQLYRY